MAIFIRYSARNSETGRTELLSQELHIPGDKPCMNSIDVIDIQADGSELADILETCVNLPHTTKRVQKWRGDFARFIIDNMW